MTRDKIYHITTRPLVPIAGVIWIGWVAHQAFSNWGVTLFYGAVMGAFYWEAFYDGFQSGKDSS